MRLFSRVKIISLLIAACSVCALSMPADASPSGVESAIAPIIDEYGLNEDNFSMGYYDPYTGEEWYYNAQAPMTGGSVYKLPLCMLYEERVNSGELTMDSVIGGYTLSRGMYFMLVESNNDVASVFEDNFGTNREFRAARVKYFGTEPESLPQGFLDDNYFTAEYSVNMLRYLYENADSYPNVLSYMLQAQPDKYFRALVDQYDIAQKYGYFDGYLNDVGIIYTPQPYLLAVYTYYKSEALLGEICRAVTDYTVAANAAWTPPESEPAEAPEPTETAGPDAGALSPAPTAKTTPPPSRESSASGMSMVYIICGASAGLLAIGVFGAAKALRRKK